MTPTVINSTAFASALRLCAKNVAKVGTVPAAKMVHLRPIGAGIEISATDLETVISMTAVGREGGWEAVCVPPETLLALLNALPEGDIEIYSEEVPAAKVSLYESQSRTLAIRRASGAWRTGGLPGEDWVARTAPEAKVEVRLKAGLLADGIRAVAWAMAEKAERNMAALALTFAPDGVLIEATDGTVGAMAKIKQDFAISEEVRVTIPARGVPSLLAALGYCVDVSVAVSDRTLHIYEEESAFEWLTLLCNAPLPKLSSAIATARKAPRRRVSYNDHDLKMALRRAVLYMNKTKPCTSFEFNDRTCTLTTENLAVQSRALDRVAIAANDDMSDFKIHFSPKLIMPAVSNCPPDEEGMVDLLFAGADAPVLLEFSDEIYGTYIVMPVLL